jgi:hypothetical protein
MRAVALAAAVGCLFGVARGETAVRYEGALFSFSYPASATVQPGTDPSADVAVTVAWKELSANVIAAQKRVPDGEIEALATQWHGARIKNRAAWGMKANGGPPRDSVRIGERRWMRWHDRIGSVLGAQEQTMTCGAVAGHLTCVVVTGPQARRADGEALTAQLLSTLTFKKR